MYNPPRSNIFHAFCLAGVVSCLVVWMLPLELKPYHILRVLDDYKIELVEQDSEWGLDADGLVKARISRQYSGGTRDAINKIREHWHSVEFYSKKRWPTDTKRPHYDEWGPSNWTRADGVHEIEVGAVYCVPYSLMAMGFSLPLIWRAVRKIRRTNFETSTEEPVTKSQ